MIYPKLYSRTSTGAIQEWTLFVEGDEFWTVYGQIGGKLITGAKTKCVPKNEGKANQTTGEVQALKEAAAEFKKKQEQGGYFLDINDIDKTTFFSPMLAKGWEDHKDDIDLSKGQWCLSDKLDGLRAIIQDKSTTSRNGKPFVSFPHVRDLLQPVFTRYPNLVLDGEIYQHSFCENFNKIISLAKKSKPTREDIEESSKLLEYWIFDCGSMNAPLSERLEFCKWVVGEVNDPRIKFVSHEIVKSEAEVENKLEKSLMAGFEGVMLKDLTSFYQNKRTKSILKYKLFKDGEFRILDIIEGVGGRSGKFGRAILELPNGKTFESNARGDEQYYIELLKNKKQYIGQLGKVRYQNFTPDGKPRFPVLIDIRNYE